MDESAAPWRALEDGPPTLESDGRTGTPVESRHAGLAWPSAWIAVAIAAAILLIGAAILVVLSGGHGSVVVDGGLPLASAPGVRASASGPDSGSAKLLVVDVQGAVMRPGIVRLADGSRVADAIVAAGGYGPRVAADRVGQVLNLAALLKDGDQVIVPSRDDRATGSTSAPGGGGSGAGSGGGSGGGGAGGGGAGGGSGTSGPVDLNHATAAELDALPGIGPVTVAKIIAAREEQPFTSIDELTSRKVLGAATLAKIKDLVVVR
jgi:competence protein ComEA